MSIINFILVPILFVVHLAAAYVIPIVATLRSQNNGQRWIIHWVVFILLRLTLFQLFDLLFDGAIYWLLLVASELGLLFALAQHTEAVKYKLLELVDQATAISKQYIALAKQQLQKVQQQAAKTVN